MADRPLAAPLPADLPEDWTSGQIVAPSGADVGLSQQHGYNYLMEQVNAAQRAANAINESFDDISGKRTCRIVIGTSTAGWTQADCDYLCDGTDDQVEIQAAIDAAPTGGCEIVLLDGEYHLGGAINVKYNIWLHGNGVATKLVRDAEDGADGIETMIGLYPGGMLSDLAYDGSGKAAEGNFEIEAIAGMIENVVFSGCGYGCIHAMGYASTTRLSRIRSCKCSGSLIFVRAEQNNINIAVEKNLVDGVSYLFEGGFSIYGNVQSIIQISGNMAPLGHGAISVDAKNVNGDSVVMVYDNYLSKIEVQDSYDAGAGYKGRGAMIFGNAFSGSYNGTEAEPAITLGSGTANSFVSGNMLPSYAGAVSDQGTNNVVRFNSDDSGDSGDGGGGTAGVTSFRGRSGAVQPMIGDYTAAMVGAIPATTVAAIQVMTQTEYDALAAKDSAALYLIKE